MPAREASRQSTLSAVAVGDNQSRRARVEGRTQAAIDAASRYVPLDQLCLSPQRGFSSTVHGDEIARESNAAKLRLMVETAREMWEAR